MHVVTSTIAIVNGRSGEDIAISRTAGFPPRSNHWTFIVLSSGIERAHVQAVHSAMQINDITTFCDYVHQHLPVISTYLIAVVIDSLSNQLLQCIVDSSQLYLVSLIIPSMYVHFAGLLLFGTSMV